MAKKQAFNRQRVSAVLTAMDTLRREGKYIKLDRVAERVQFPFYATHYRAFTMAGFLSAPIKDGKITLGKRLIKHGPYSASDLDLVINCFVADSIKHNRQPKPKDVVVAARSTVITLEAKPEPPRFHVVVGSTVIQYQDEDAALAGAGLVAAEHPGETVHVMRTFAIRRGVVTTTNVPVDAPSATEEE